MKPSLRRFDCAGPRWGLLLLAAGTLLPWFVGCGRSIGLRDINQPGPALQRVAERYKSLTTFSENTTLRRTISGPESQDVTTAQTSLFFSRPNKLFWSRSGPDAIVIASDGKKLTVYRKADNSYVTADMPATLAEFLRDHPSDAAGIHELALLAGQPVDEVLTDPKVEAGETLSGQPMKILRGAIREMTNEKSAEPVQATQRVWLGVQDALIHKNVIEVKRGNATLTIEENMTAAAADPAIPSERFTYSPPKGARNLGRAEQ